MTKDSTAPASPAQARPMNVTLGAAPNSWGIWFADDPRQVPWTRYLDEVVEVGYTLTELGPVGYMPKDPEVLARELGDRGLQTTCSYVMFDFEAEDAWTRNADVVRETCELITALGGEYLMLTDDVYSDLFTGEPRIPSELQEHEWAQMFETTSKIVEVALEYGLRPIFHPHAETHVEYEWQIERFFAGCDPRLELLLDVGHHTYRGGDPIAMIHRYGDRLGYLHLKSVDAQIRQRVEDERIPFATAVAMDVFTEPDAGLVDYVAVRDALIEVGYEGPAIVEQDMYPCEPDRPLPVAKRTRDYLRSLGFR